MSSQGAGLTAASNMSTLTPARCKVIAQTRPDTPPPIMATWKSLVAGGCIVNEQERERVVHRLRER